MNKYLWIIIFLASCGVKKVITPGAVDFPEKTEELINIVNSKNQNPQWLTLKGRANILQNDKNLALNVNIKHRKDSIIWISASGPFGIEIIRAQITVDSIYFINRIDKTYFTKSLSYIKDLINTDLTFYELQDILTANTKIANKSYKLKATENGAFLITDSSSYFVNKNYKVQELKMIEANNIEVKFEDYKVVDNFPRRVNLIIGGGDKFKITIDYFSVEFNKSQTFLFEITTSYEETK